MPRSIYLKLAVHQLKCSRQVVLPFIYSGAFCTAMLYIISSLYENPAILSLYGGSLLKEFLGFGRGVLLLFIFIFLFYTNTFVSRTRSRPYGLYALLGMEKKHLLRILFYELLLSLAASLLMGLIAGLIFEKLAYLLVLYLLGESIQLGFHFSTPALIQSSAVISACFALLLIGSAKSVIKSSPQILFASSRQPSKNPRTFFVFGLLGFAFLGAGYYIAQITRNPLESLYWYFAAVALVMAGTYFLFRFGSLLILKMLEKNRKFYYQASHFITISNMKYRMKENALSLANICILSTMVLVSISTTLCLYTGMQEILDAQYPKAYEISFSGSAASLAESLKEQGIELENEEAFDYFTMTMLDRTVSYEPYLYGSTQEINLDEVCIVYFASISDYNRSFGTDYTLKENEIITDTQTMNAMESLDLFGQSFEIAGSINESLSTSRYFELFYPVHFVLVSSPQKLQEIYDYQNTQMESYVPGNWYSSIMYDSKSSEADMEQAIANYQSALEDQDLQIELNSKEKQAINNRGLYGGFLFIGLFLSIVFMAGCALIMYYKQIAEGTQDQTRFEIMRQIGLEEKQIHSMIRFQVLSMFFAPLLLAVVHVFFNFKIVSSLLLAFGLSNTNLFIIVTLICLAAFAILYFILYSLTSRVYYQMVRTR